MPTPPAIHCAKCGYDLKGLGSRPCPECASTERAFPETPSRLARPLYWVLALLAFATITFAVPEYTPFGADIYFIMMLRVLLSPLAAAFAVVVALIMAARTRNRSPFRRVNMNVVISSFIAAAIAFAVIGGVAWAIAIQAAFSH